VWALNEACNAPGCPGKWLVYQGIVDDKPAFRCATCGTLFYYSRRIIMANEELQNCNLEPPFVTREAGEVVVAEDWEPWYDHGKTRPEWKPETRTVGRGRVHQGETAQKQFTLYKVHDAGIWQRVNATPGQWYRLTAWLYMWSSQEDDPDTSIQPGKMHSMVGINPWGHWPEHTATIWGKELAQDQYNQWVKAEVIAQAWHPEISVVVRSWNEWKAKHNDLYIDEIALEPITVTIGDPGQPPPQPGPGEPIDYDRIKTETAQATLDLIRASDADLIAHLLAQALEYYRESQA
jgi:hypothetical protein